MIESVNDNLSTSSNSLSKCKYRWVEPTPYDGRIEGSRRLQRDQIIIEIADNGRGMDEAFQNKLFERYYREMSTQEWMGKVLE